MDSDQRTVCGLRVVSSCVIDYDREGRPCHRCGTLIEEKSQGSELPRTTYFCPSCQASLTAAAAGGGAKRSRSRAAS